MADWNGAWRTNYVKIREDRIMDLALFDIELWTTPNTGLSAMYSNDEYGGTPTIYLDDDDLGDLPEYLQKHTNQVDDYLSIEDVIHEFLEPDQTIIIMCSGAEKQRYITGYAIAIHSSGASVSVNLQDIYKKAQEAWPGSNVTEARY